MDRCNRSNLSRYRYDMGGGSNIKSGHSDEKGSS
jgi:hypothetical protein